MFNLFQWSQLSLKTNDGYIPENIEYPNAICVAYIADLSAHTFNNSNFYSAFYIFCLPDKMYRALGLYIKDPKDINTLDISNLQWFLCFSIGY